MADDRSSLAACVGYCINVMGIRLAPVELRSLDGYPDRSAGCGEGLSEQLDRVFGLVRQRRGLPVVSGGTALAWGFRLPVVCQRGAGVPFEPQPLDEIGRASCRESE